jgi:hypothetical protein
MAAYGGGARAQGGPPMLTDDPGTPGDGHWEINIAALTDFAAGVHAYQLPLIDVNYGLGERLQLKYEVPFMVEHEFDASRSGMGNSLLGVKWRFYDAGQDAWQVSTYPQIQFNYPDSASPRRGLAEAGTSVLLPLEFAKSYAEFGLDFEIGRWLRPSGQGDSWIAGVVVGRDLRKGLEVMAELHEEGDTAFARNESVVNLGLRWDISGRYTLLASAGRDLHNGFGATNSLLTYLGIQLHL